VVFFFFNFLGGTPYTFCFDLMKEILLVICFFAGAGGGSLLEGLVKGTRPGVRLITGGKRQFLVGGG